MHIFKEVPHLFLKNYSYWTKTFYVQLRDAFFFFFRSSQHSYKLLPGHWSWPSRCEADIPYWKRLRWSKRKPVDRISITVFISAGTDTSFLKCWSEMLLWDSEWCGRIFSLKLSSCWGLPVIKDRRRWFGWGQWFQGLSDDCHVSGFTHPTILICSDLFISVVTPALGQSAQFEMSEPLLEWGLCVPPWWGFWLR